MKLFITQLTERRSIKINVSTGKRLSQVRKRKFNTMVSNEVLVDAIINAGLDAIENEDYEMDFNYRKGK